MLAMKSPIMPEGGGAPAQSLTEVASVACPGIGRAGLAILRAIESGHRSDRAIAAALGLTRESVRQARRRLQAALRTAADFQAIGTPAQTVHGQRGTASARVDVGVRSD